MNIHTVDLYERYGIPRNGASGGFLTAFIRTESAEIKKRIRPSVLIIPGGGYEVLSDREAEPIAIKFMNSGFCAFVLSYSLRTKYLAPLIEAMLLDSGETISKSGNMSIMSFLRSGYDS